MIVADIPSGICNRLKNITSAWRLDDDVRVYWPINRFTSMTFSQLFENDIEIFDMPENINTQCSERFLVKDSDPIPEWFAEDHKFDQVKNLFGNDPDFRKLHKKKEINNGRNIDHEYERIPQELQETYSSLMKRLNLRKDLMDKINDYHKSVLGENVVTIHMRTWHDDARRKKLFSLESFMSEMDKWDGYNFYIAADNMYFIPMLRERYGDRVKYYEQRPEVCSPGELNDELTELSLIELYLLSKGKHIIGSYLSTYSEVAWYLGECKAGVTIP